MSEFKYTEPTPESVFIEYEIMSSWFCGFKWRGWRRKLVDKFIDRKVRKKYNNYLIAFENQFSDEERAWRSRYRFMKAIANMSDPGREPREDFFIQFYKATEEKYNN